MNIAHRTQPRKLGKKSGLCFRLWGGYVGSISTIHCTDHQFRPRRLSSKSPPRVWHNQHPRPESAALFERSSTPSSIPHCNALPIHPPPRIPRRRFCAEHQAGAPGLNSGAPLTVPLASLQPSPTGTDAAIASAYAKYADDCGAPLAQALQDGLVAYNHWSHVPTTNISDPKFLSFVNTDYFPYMDARAACEQDEHQLGFAEADALRSSGVKSTKASVTGTAQSNTGAVGGGSGGGGGTGVASPTANPRASPSPSPNGADSRRRPGMLDLLTLLLGSAYLLRFV